jgi:hypothetical protein
MLFRTLGRICYGLSITSIGLSLLMRLRMKGIQPQTRFFLFQRAPTDTATEHLSIFLGLWAPTFGIAGKILEDMGRDQNLHRGITSSRANNQQDAIRQAATTASNSRP